MGLNDLEKEARLAALEELMAYLALLSSKPGELSQEERKEIAKGSEEFKAIADFLSGTQENKIVAFIDLMGTKAGLARAAASGEKFDQISLVSAHSWFSFLLERMAEFYPELQVFQFSDSGLIVGDSAAEVFAATIHTFRLASIQVEEFNLVPLRAGIARGLTKFGSEDGPKRPKNFTGFPYLGEAYVKAQMLERCEKKGMHLFITESALTALPPPLNEPSWAEPMKDNVSILGEASEPYYMVNWLSNRGYLDKLVGGVSIRSHYSKWSDHWLQSGDQHKAQIAESIRELLIE